MESDVSNSATIDRGAIALDACGRGKQRRSLKESRIVSIAIGEHFEPVFTRIERVFQCEILGQRDGLAIKTRLHRCERSRAAICIAYALLTN